jgi:hypothetical protein
MLNRGFTVVVVVVEYNIFDFSVVPDVSASGQLNVFFFRVFVVTTNFSRA